MIINFHAKEIESKNTIKLIETLKQKDAKVLHITDKTKEEWQNIVKSNETMIFVGPVYWWGLGYELDKWIQNVFAYGFAYEYNKEGVPEGKLQNRNFEIHLIHGTPEKFSEKMRTNIEQRLQTGIFNFCQATIQIYFYAS